MAAFGAAGAAEKKRELPGDHALTPSDGGSVETVTETGHLVGICRKRRRDENRPASRTLASEIPRELYATAEPNWSPTDILGIGSSHLPEPIADAAAVGSDAGVLGDCGAGRSAIPIPRLNPTV
ncbi:hypothetical protein V6679_15885 [Nocardia testacea]